MVKEEAPNTLIRFFSLYQDNPAVSVLYQTFRSLLFSGKSPDDPARMKTLYEEAFRTVERDASTKGYDEVLLGLQRDLYRELEQMLSVNASDNRHHFLIVIPVADRPLMLRNCLLSLIRQCHAFSYGGASSSTGSPLFKKVSVFVFDDSMEDANSRRIREICAETTASGIRTSYIGIEEQTNLLKNVPPELLKKAAGLIGEFKGIARRHKGASITRNIAYLYIRSCLEEIGEETLTWFIDSDEEFAVKVKRDGEIIDIPFINYFYWLDRIFTEAGVDVFTGKVVGDPPVTPSVMLNTFVDDMICFLEDITDIDPGEACNFHYDNISDIFQAEYHDMVKLFGYRQTSSPKRYSCVLAGNHSVSECFGVFADRSLGFFYGLHPTRTQFYSHGDGFSETAPARTVYTGNYVISEAGLRHFIPSAALGFRMAGPTLGRILRKKIGEKFVSANLPLLHRRTDSIGGMNEFRSGVVRDRETIDLSEEFLRQFWGDVVLFSTETLCEIGYPERPLETTEIADIVRTVRERIWGIYMEHQKAAAEKVSRLRRILSDPARWWNAETSVRSSIASLQTFVSVAERNFGPSSDVIGKLSRQIEAGEEIMKIIAALNAYYADELVWNELLNLY